MKQALQCPWRDLLIEDAPAVLRDALSRSVSTLAALEFRYWRGALIWRDRPEETLVHVMFHADTKQALVTWTGPGVRLGVVVYARGTLEGLKRKLEAGAISSVPTPPRAATRLPAVRKRKPVDPFASVKSLPRPPAPGSRLLLSRS